MIVGAPSENPTALCYNISTMTLPKTAAALLAALAIAAHAAPPDPSGSEVVDGVTWYYTIEDGAASVCHSAERGDCYTGDLVVPKTLGGLPVKRLADGAFTDCTATSVVLPEGITSIGQCCFYNDWDLLSINFPSTLKRLEFMALISADLSGVIELPAGIENIDAAVFACCNRITEIRIPESNRLYKNVGSAIYTADGKTLIRGPSTGDFVVPPDCEEFAFEACLYSDISSITFSKPIKLGGSCLHIGRNLTTIIYPKGTTAIGNEVSGFAVTTVAIPRSVKSLDRWGLAMTSLKTVYCEPGDEERVKSLFDGHVSYSGTRLDRISFEPFEWPEVQTTPLAVRAKSDAEISAWASRYPRFAETHGSDVRAALAKDAVWRSFIAGTDPTDESDGFKALLTIENGEPKLSWSPVLPEAEAAKRKYTLFGKRSLGDAHWDRIQPGDEREYEFFSVQVDLK